jgi:holo-[acyl-carrier protein] synthase
MLRTGVDLVEIARFQKVIERYGERFLKRVFTAKECAEAGQSLASLAARFAAKEAVSKALGTGIGVVAWQEIEILRDATRRPCLFLHGMAARQSESLGLREWSVSLSHDQNYAIAVVVAIGD